MAALFPFISKKTSAQAKACGERLGVAKKLSGWHVGEILRRNVVYALKKHRFDVRILPLFCLFGCLGGCAKVHYHRGPIDMWVDMIHKMRGGIGSELLPPAPGTHGAYPFVGDVPKENPEFPSRPAQIAMTEKLKADRNWAQRHAAETGKLEWPNLGPPPPMSDLAGNLIMPDNPTKPVPPPAPVKQEMTGSEITPVEQDGSELIDHRGLPKVIYHPNSHADIPVSKLPVIPPAPPVPFYPGFYIPRGSKTVEPDKDYRDPEGILIHFEPLTDKIANGEEGHLRDAVSTAQAEHKRYVVTGFGDAISAEAGLSTRDQGREVAFGLLRAQAVAARLIEMGANPREISVSGQPIGDGARIVLEPK